MNPIQKAIVDLKVRIPREILERTFVQPDAGYFSTMNARAPVSLDFQIRNKVIDAFVLPDCNLAGGLEITVDLGNVIPQQLNDYSMVYRIPKTMTENRTITRVIHLTFGDGGVVGSMNLAIQGRSPMMDAAQGMLQANLPVPMVSTANIHIVAENVILIRDNIQMPGNPFLRCVVENDSEMNHLDPGSVKDFCKLVELATKMYIFNNRVIPMDQAELQGGMALGRFREIIDSYSDAAEQYETFLRETWQQVALFNDPERRKRHLKMICGGRW